MNFTSEKRLIDLLNIDRDQAKKIRLVIKACKRAALLENFDSCVELERICYHKPNFTHLKATALNEIIEGFGIETMGKVLNDGRFSQRYDYINTGHIDAATLIHDNRRNHWFVGYPSDYIV